MENEIKNSFRSGYTKGLGFGLLLMLIGIVFLGVNFGFVTHEARRILISWPMLLIVIGVFNIIKSHNLSATILIIIGGFFLIPRIIDAYPAYFPGINGNFTHTYWPLLLIAAGILLIVSKLIGRNYGFADYKDFDYKHHQKHHHYKTNNINGFSKNSIFGSGEHIVLDPEFKGGELNAVFGGITLDLRKTNLAEGETILEINAVFGGVTIIVPPEWLVETHLDAVFGGFEDKRFKLDAIDSSKKLVIVGACVFGGGELRD
ncbi:MAG: DUF5668 domain-containing protein [Paludibacter sp.]|jgi:predicted membrane protein|nr:DUF5668 domain-containing protein [Paludibacter sp.]